MTRLRSPPNSTARERSAVVAAIALAVAIAAGLVFLAPAGAAADAGPTEPVADNHVDGANNSTTLTLLTYNDIQTAASNPTAMGRLVGTIEQRRAAIDNPTVVVGGGDQVSPSSLSPVSNWTVPVEALNELDPAAEVIGNHDLDFGFEPVPEFAAASEFPWLLANVEGPNGEHVPGTEPYRIVERGGVEVGIVGLVDEAIYGKTAVDFAEAGYEVTDFAAAGDEIATRLKEEEGVDVVVAAAHIGIPESEELAEASDAIDAIVVGDDELVYPPETTSDTVIVEAEARANYVGEINLTVADGEVEMANGRLIEVTDEAPVDETAESIVADAREQFLGQVAGETTVELDSRFSSNYAEDTEWGNVITDAFLARTGADVAVTNAGGIRGDFVIEEGPITYNDVYTSLPFGNTLVTKEMTGTELRQLLESQVTDLTAQFGAQAQLQVSGVTYEFVDDPAAEAPIRELYVGGEPLDPDATYEVTVNSFMAGWTFEDRYGWNMEDLPTVEEDLTLYGEAVAEYVEDNSPIEPTEEDRIRRVTAAAPGTVATGEETVTLEYQLPETADAVEADSVVIESLDSTATTETLAPANVSVSEGTLTVMVEADALTDLATTTDELELYAAYNDTELDGQRASYEDSRFNGETVVVSPARAIAGHDNVVTLEEVRTALEYWDTDAVVPGSDRTVETDDVLTLLQHYRTGDPLDTEPAASITVTDPSAAVQPAIAP